MTVGCMVVGCDDQQASVAGEEKIALSQATITPTAKPAATQSSTNQPTTPSTSIADHSQFQAVDLNQFIEQELKVAEKLEGRKLIKQAQPIRFDAKIMRLPQVKKASYIYTALEVAKVSPLPDIEHQMFIESAGGRIISVYVEKQAALKIEKQLAAGKVAQFFGYHVYTYSRGPAILIADFVQGDRDAK